MCYRYKKPLLLLLPTVQMVVFSLIGREEELSIFADHFWSVDGYARRDKDPLSDYMEPYRSTFSGIVKAGEGDVVLGSSRDAKGNSLIVYGDGNEWIMLGKLIQA